MVAVQRERGSQCRNLNRNERFRPRRDCSQPRWLRAHGTSHWRYRTRRALPPGHYRLHRVESSREPACWLPHLPASVRSNDLPQRSAVTIKDFKFAPASLTVKSRAKVTVTNDDSTAHDLTADDGNSFDTGTMDPGSSKTLSVSKPGSHAYHCSIHPFMKGTLVAG